MTAFRHMKQEHRKLEVPGEVQPILNDGLILLRDIIESLGLTYYLAYGTLLGAARHNGFIPWDDDVDILMPRDDYEALIDEVSVTPPLQDWELLSYRTKHGFYFPWAKFCNTKTIIEPSRFLSGLKYGCSIDIFSLDSIDAQSETEAIEYRNSVYSQFQKLKKLYQPFGVLSNKSVKHMKPLEKRLRFCKATLLHGSWQKQLTKLDARNVETSGMYLASLYVKYPCAWHRGLFEAPNGEKRFLMFEGSPFRVPYRYEEVLTTLYGDYMKLPPENERVSKHYFTGIFWCGNTTSAS